MSRLKNSNIYCLKSSADPNMYIIYKNPYLVIYPHMDPDLELQHCPRKIYMLMGRNKAFGNRTLLFPAVASSAFGNSAFTASSRRCAILSRRSESGWVGGDEGGGLTGSPCRSTPPPPRRTSTSSIAVAGTPLPPVSCNVM